MTPARAQAREDVTGTAVPPRPSAALAAEIGEHLRRTPPQLPAKYFYDALGSALFDAICQLPWYRITRAESALLTQHRAAILGPFGRSLTIAELGCGNGEKLGHLVAAATEPVAALRLIDISPAALEAARQRLERLAAGPIALHAATYEQGIDALATTGRAGPLLVLFLGSNIGNFEPGPARALLARLRGALRPGDALLLGADLVKPEGDLLLAYDDPLQVTAAFNRNVLRRINDELGGDFNLEAWAHRASWNAAASRVEMHLVAQSPQHVRIPAAAVDRRFAAGETIWTESSYKYDVEGLLAMTRAAGFGAADVWTDDRARFALARFHV